MVQEARLIVQVCNFASGLGFFPAVKMMMATLAIASLISHGVELRRSEQTLTFIMNHDSIRALAEKDLILK